MNEVELKFQVSPAQRKAVDAAVAGRGGATRQRLVAQYLDTPERDLAEAAIALRLRREGRRWVQTLKGGAEDGITRPEHNVERGAGALPPIVDPALHAGTPAGERLAALLAGHHGAGLQALFGTDVLRRSRRVRRAGSQLELCFDQGRIRAGERRVPVSELEIELVAGAPQAVVDEARRWVARHGLWLDTRTKAERGDLLARGEAMAPPRGARPVALDPDMSAAQAWRAVLRACTDQIAANASQIAAGVHVPEHVHQLRVGLRRLRSAIRLFGTAADEAPLFEPALAEAVAQWFGRLGAVRDEDVLRGPVAEALDAAWAAAGGSAAAAGAPAAAASAATAIARDGAAQRLLLDLIAGGLEAGRADAPADAEPLRRRLADRIGRWHRRAVRDAARYDELDDEGRHRLRKRVKRLRYAVEFAAALFDASRVRRYLKPLRALQDRLGEINDAVMALDRSRAVRDADRADPRAWFELGWLAARRDALIAQAAPELAAFAKSRRFWK